MIKTIIVDDEQPSLDKLAKLLNESAMVEIKGKFTQPFAALEFLETNKIDAVFLDIEMPDMDGIELSNRVINIQGQIAVVFVTAYNQYAVEAFRLNALDYLMKPATAERLNDTLKRIVTEKQIQIQPAPVQIHCFGKFKVNVGTAEVKFRTEKAQELLAYLIDQRGDFVHRGVICDHLWEEYDGDRALIHFNTTLYYVKKALLQQGVEIQVEYDKGCYRLNIEGLDCDYHRFRKFITTTGRVAQSNILEYEEIASLYRGDYLAGTEYIWAEQNRQMLKERYIMLLLQISAYYEAGGDPQKTISWLKLGLTQEPLHRELNYQLVEALLWANDRVSADKYYNLYKSNLMRKLKQEPDVSFQKLLLLKDKGNIV